MSALPKDTTVDDPFAPDDRHDRCRDEGFEIPQARFRRGREPPGVSQRPGDFVSAADRKAEGILRDALQKARPDYGLIMEESGIVEGSDKSHRWHIDPLDGTTNFLHGIPQFAISVGLEREGQIVAGIVYDPAKDELFIAE